jgi:hypothetical protein
MESETVYVNGIDGVTGKYLIPPMSVAELAALARGEPRDAWLTSWVKNIAWRLKEAFLGLPIDVDPTRIAQAGWAVVFAANAPAEMRDALEPLIAHRRTQVAPDRLKVLDYQPGETARDWLKRHKTAFGNIVPTSVPYYVLIVGDPTEIPFGFQYLLDTEYAVGRLAFDESEQYQRYAESVVAYETAAVPTAREVAFWGPRQPGDGWTQLCSDYLIAPLADGTAGQQPIAEAYGFKTRRIAGDEATKEALLGLLHRSAEPPPAMLFTGSHGVGYPLGHARQREGQGALVCQQSAAAPGQGPSLLAGSDVADEARVHGTIAFFVACYGAGTPAWDAFLKDRNQKPVPIADQPFVAALPRRLLSHPNGSSLAAIGHIERIWGHSIVPTGIVSALVPFRNLIGRILSGEPVGHATKDFSDRYATLSAELLSDLDDAQAGKKLSETDLASRWTERNDAQNYVVLGDPAVRIRPTV